MMLFSRQGNRISEHSIKVLIYDLYMAHKI